MAGAPAGRKRRNNTPRSLVQNGQNFQNGAKSKYGPMVIDHGNRENFTVVFNRLKQPTPDEKVILLARVTCQLFGNLLAILERVVPGKKPDYVVVMRYAMAITGLQYRSRHIRDSGAGEVVRETYEKAARSIAQSLENDARIDDPGAFFRAYMAEPLEEFSASIDTLTLDTAMGMEASARKLALKYASDVLGEPDPIEDDEIDEFVKDFEERTTTASRIILKNT